ncbi:hypothetical protein KDL45_05870, partial [bacterium]|nr:hypothetical protein [bacterium]
MKSLGHFFLILLMCLLTVATFASCGDDDDDDSDAVSDDDTADDDTVDDDTSDDDDDDDTVTDDDTVDDDDDDTTDDDDDTSDDDTADDDTTDDDTGDDDTEPVFADEFRAVEMGSASPALKIAAHACQGLYNDELGGSVYTLSNSTDPIWLDELELEPVETISAADFVAECAAQYPCVKYDYTQQGLIPAVITAGVAL